MAEEIPRGPEPTLEADQHDDVLGKIDQLLNRHRPKTAVADAVPVLTDASREEAVPVDDEIPILRDVVSGPGRPTKLPPSPARPSAISSVLILRRMAIALEAEHARLRTQIGGDAMQARMLDRLVAELRRALPAAVRAAITVKTPDPSRPDDDGRL
ncbi:MAG: hypothetical protein HY067_16450 [Betaproteobacteria bacterium]|nr:hypothetical protein [Betaproteobacteria bacterium]